MSVINSIPLIAAGDDGYQISRSVRLRSSATAYLNRTFGTPTNEKIWTWSAWVKRGNLGILSSLFNASTGASPAYDGFRFNTSDQLQFFTGGAVTVNLVTNAVYRDPSAWYHIVLSYNATTTTVTIYVNGVAQTTTGTTVSNTTYSFNHASTLHSIGAQVVNGAYTAGTYFDGYMTEINFIDGQALTPSSFGETNAITGVWQPKKYVGTYGTNGFYLNFSDNSAATATTIGKDYSGNGNNWTPNNISVTAGATYDSMLDVPTLYADGGNGRGNYAVLSPTDLNAPGNNASCTLSNGNLAGTLTNGANRALSTIGVLTGKWYAEVVITSITGGATNSGVLVGYIGGAGNGAGGGAGMVQYQVTGNKRIDTGSAAAYGASYTTGDIIGVALDMDAGQVTFYKNNASQGAITLTTTGSPYGIGFNWNSAVGQTVVIDANFGQRPFTYTPPTGYVALNTQNLPTHTISNGANYMAASLWTGDASTPRAVVSNLAFSPDLVWTKDRSVGYQHSLQDTVRGTGASKKLYSSLTEAENGANSVYGHINSFDANGFTVATGSSGAQHVNASGVTYVGWSWKAGGTAVSNTSGSITSTVSAGATQGFSVVTFAGASTQGATVGHGLGVAPKMVIAKNRTAAQNWWVYHVSLGYANNIILNSTAASAADANTWRATPSSTVITIGDNFATGSNYVAYCFSEVVGYSKFGSYTGNGSADGPFVFLGFRPRFVMIKRTDTAGTNWHMLDSARDAYNASGLQLYSNLSAADDDYRASNPTDFLSNGFKSRNTLSGANASGGTYIYAAFAENPFKNSLAR